MKAIRNLIVLKIHLATLIGTVLFHQTTAQVKGADSSVYEKSVQYAIARYVQSAGLNSGLHNGPAYTMYNHGMTGHPFYHSDQFANGSVYYNGASWSDIPLLYDMVLDKLIIEYNHSGNLMELISEKAKWFNMHGHSFVFIGKGSDTIQNSPRPGFYEQVFSGKASVVMVKRGKRIKVPANTSMQPFFLEENTFYVRRDNQFYLVNNKHDLLIAYEDRKKEISKQVKKQPGNFKKNKEAFITGIANYYEQLIK